MNCLDTDYYRQIDSLLHYVVGADDFRIYNCKIAYQFRALHKDELEQQISRRFYFAACVVRWRNGWELWQVRLPAAAVLGSDSGKVVHTRASATKQYSLVLVMLCGWEGNRPQALRKVMAVDRRVYGFGHMRLICQERDQLRSE